MRTGWDRPSHPGQRGSVTVLSAGILFLAAALALVAVDLLRALDAKSRAQTAADASALAAAQEIAIPSGLSPEEVAADYASRNGATLLSCECDPGTSQAIVEVQVRVDLVFVGPDTTVQATARAVIEGGSGTLLADTPPSGGAPPVAICWGSPAAASRRPPRRTAPPGRAAGTMARDARQGTPVRDPDAPVEGPALDGAYGQAPGPSSRGVRLRVGQASAPPGVPAAAAVAV